MPVGLKRRRLTGRARRKLGSLASSVASATFAIIAALSSFATGAVSNVGEVGCDRVQDLWREHYGLALNETNHPLLEI